MFSRVCYQRRLHFKVLNYLEKYYEPELIHCLESLRDVVEDEVARVHDDEVRVPVLGDVVLEGALVQAVQVALDVVHEHVVVLLRHLLENGLKKCFLKHFT